MLSNKKFIQIDIVDNDYNSDEPRIMDSYIIVIPNDEIINYNERIKHLQEMLNNRFDEENNFTNYYGAIYDYLVENFEILDISNRIEVEW